MTLVLTYNSHGLVNIRSNSKLSDLILNSWRTFLWFTQNSNTLKDYLWVSSWGSFCIYELEQNNFVHTPQVYIRDIPNYFHDLCWTLLLVFSISYTTLKKRIHDPFRWQWKEGCIIWTCNFIVHNVHVFLLCLDF